MLMSRYQLGAVLLVTSLLITPSYSAQPNPNLITDKQSISINKRLTIVDSCSSKDRSNNVSITNLSYWQHINTYPDEFSGLRFVESESSRYKLTPLKTSESTDSECINRDIILVKKVIHNQRQHANGIEVDLTQRQLTFGNLRSFNMRFQLNRQLSFMPAVSTLKSVFNEQNLAQSSQQTVLINQLTNQLLNQNITLKLVFYGNNHSDYKTMTVNGDKLVELSPTVPDGSWLELELTNSDLNTYWEKNWQETPTQLIDILDQPILGFTLVAETPSGKTVESLIKGFSEPDVKELFIESYIRLGSIRIDQKM